MLYCNFGKHTDPFNRCFGIEPPIKHYRWVYRCRFGIDLPVRRRPRAACALLVDLPVRHRPVSDSVAVCFCPRPRHARCVGEYSHPAIAGLEIIAIFFLQLLRR